MEHWTAIVCVYIYIIYIYSIYIVYIYIYNEAPRLEFSKRTMTQEDQISLIWVANILIYTLNIYIKLIFLNIPLISCSSGLRVLHLGRFWAHSPLLESMSCFALNPEWLSNENSNLGSRASLLKPQSSNTGQGTTVYLTPWASSVICSSLELCHTRCKSNPSCYIIL